MPQTEATVHQNKEDSEEGSNDDKSDHPELFLVMDLDEENDIRTELFNHPNVKVAMRTLHQQANFQGASIAKPSPTTTARATVDIEPSLMQGFIFPSEGKTAFPDINMVELWIAFTDTLKQLLNFWQELEDKSRVCEVCILSQLSGPSRPSLPTGQCQVEVLQVPRIHALPNQT